MRTATSLPKVFSHLRSHQLYRQPGSGISVHITDDETEAQPQPSINRSSQIQDPEPTLHAASTPDITKSFIATNDFLIHSSIFQRRVKSNYKIWMYQSLSMQQRIFKNPCNLGLKVTYICQEHMELWRATLYYAALQTAPYTQLACMLEKTCTSV